MERSSGLLGKIQEFIDPTPIEDKYTQLLNRAYTEIFQPMGFKRAGQNFRLFTPDGLGKIVNFRKDKWNQKGRRLGFLIYTGVYFEPEPVIKDRKFKEYDCQIRGSGDNPTPTDLYGKKGEEFSYNKQFWYIFKRTDMEAMYQDLKQSMEDVFDWFDHFESRQAVIDMILSGTAQQYSHTIVMNYNVAKMLAELGYQAQVYAQIKDTRTTNSQAWAVIRLAEDLEKELGL